MNSRSQNLSLDEAASFFLADLSPEEKEAGRQEIYHFVRWFGRERPLAGLAAAEVANYAERLSTTDTDYLRKLKLVRAFLAYVKKEGWSQSNLAASLKVRKEKAKRQPSSRQGSRGTVSLTRQGYAELEAELATLHSKRLASIDEIRRAAADKDFRENVPLAAAREQRGLLEGRIRELEETMKSAVVIDEQPKATPTVGIGDNVILCDLDSGEERCYTLVSPREVDPTRGRISSASPIGRAVVGRRHGEIVEVTAPAGKLRFQVKQVER